MYPKICKSRFDHQSQVVVANAEQEAALPEEFQEQRTGGQSDATDVMLSPEYGAILAEREKLEKDRAEFAEHMAAQEKALAEQRAELTAGYKASMEQLEADRAAWEASKGATASAGDDIAPKRGPGRPPKDA